MQERWQRVADEMDVVLEAIQRAIEAAGDVRRKSIPAKAVVAMLTKMKQRVGAIRAELETIGRDGDQRR